MASMMNPPIATPRTGPPAPTIDHQPIAFTRSPDSNRLSTSAIEDAPSPAPTRPPSARAAMRVPASGAERGEDRDRDVADHPDEVETAMAPPVAQLSRQRDRDGHGEHRGGDHPGDRRDARVQSGRNTRKSHDEDGDENVARKQARQNDREHQPVVPVARARPAVDPLADEQRPGDDRTAPRRAASRT